jgi:hypothetical protein
MAKNRSISILTAIANVIAALVSFYYNKSFLWAIFHFMFGWLYLIYSLLLGRFADGNLFVILSSYF